MTGSRESKKQREKVNNRGREKLGHAWANKRDPRSETTGKLTPGKWWDNYKASYPECDQNSFNALKATGKLATGKLTEKHKLGLIIKPIPIPTECSKS